MLPMIFGALAPSLLTGMSPMLAAAIGSGVGSLLQGGSGEDALKSAALGGIGAGIGGGFGAGAEVAATPMTPFGTGASSAGIDGLAGITGASGAGNALSSLPTATSLPYTGLGSINTNAAGGAAVMPSSGGFGINSDFNFMDALKNPAGIGAGIGAGMYTPEYKEKEKEEKEYPRGMPIKNTSIFPEYGYDAGKEGEFDYNIAKNYAEGGPLEEEGMPSMDMAPMDMGLGGMTENGMNDKELISGAIDVIQGEINDPDQQKVILAQFVSQFGQEALQDLVARVQSGDIPAGPQEGDGKIEGAGDGMADMVPATMEGDQDVLLSDGEFVVPADVVSGIGNGSSDAGSNKLEDMMDRVRELRTGGTIQPPAIPDEMMLPA